VLFLLFIRFLPIMPMAELKAVTPQADVHGHHDQPAVQKGHA
jgi:molybdopterin-containing oxidoreductase family membrane subunit